MERNLNYFFRPPIDGFLFLFYREQRTISMSVQRLKGEMRSTCRICFGSPKLMGIQSCLDNRCPSDNHPSVSGCSSALCCGVIPTACNLVASLPRRSGLSYIRLCVLTVHCAPGFVLTLLRSSLAFASIGSCFRSVIRPFF